MFPRDFYLKNSNKLKIFISSLIKDSITVDYLESFQNYFQKISYILYTVYIENKVKILLDKMKVKVIKTQI